MRAKVGLVVNDDVRFGDAVLADRHDLEAERLGLQAEALLAVGAERHGLARARARAGRPGPVFRSVIRSKTPSLNTGQFWRISMNDAPLCARAALNASGSFFDVSKARATKVARAPRAKRAGTTGWSIEPSGLEGVTLPTCDVGEYCPLVRP